MSLPGKLPDLGGSGAEPARRPSELRNDDNPSNAELKGDALVTALQPMNWDPSVKSIIAFPFVGLCASEPAGHRWGAPENQVRSGLSAGGKWIRTLGPARSPASNEAFTSPGRALHRHRRCLAGRRRRPKGSMLALVRFAAIPRGYLGLGGQDGLSLPVHTDAPIGA
jgi:hypothetical protein